MFETDGAEALVDVVDEADVGQEFTGLVQITALSDVETDVEEVVDLAPVNYEDMVKRLAIRYRRFKDVKKDPRRAEEYEEVMNSGRIGDVSKLEIIRQRTKSYKEDGWTRYPLLTDGEVEVLARLKDHAIERLGNLGTAAVTNFRSRLSDSPGRESLKVLAGIEARQILVTCNMRIVKEFARELSRKDGVTDYELKQELIGVGNARLSYIASKFDPRKGKFSTIAYLGIEQEMKEYMRLHTSVQGRRVPSEIGKIVTEIRNTTSQWVALFDREPDDEELADYIGISVERLKLVKETTRHLVYLDSPINDGDNTINDVVTVNDEDTPERRVARRSLNEQLAWEIETLFPEREAAPMRLFVGLDGNPMTYVEIADELNQSVDWTRRLVMRGISMINRLEFLRDNPSAACNGIPLEVMFPYATIGNSAKNKGRYTDAAEDALAICRTCNVVDKCLKQALDEDDKYSIAGGLVPQERVEIRLKRTA